MPVLDTRPPVVARPNACVSWSKLAQVDAGLRARRARARVDLDALHRREVDDDAAVDGGEAGDAVAAAAHGDEQLLAAGELDARAMTSATPAQRAISAGWRSCAPFQIARASS